MQLTGVVPSHPANRWVDAFPMARFTSETFALGVLHCMRLLAVMKSVEHGTALCVETTNAVCEASPGWPGVELRCWGALQ